MSGATGQDPGLEECPDASRGLGSSTCRRSDFTRDDNDNNNVNQSWKPNTRQRHFNIRTDARAGRTAGVGHRPTSRRES
jgi:hypothetical protein